MRSAGLGGYQRAWFGKRQTQPRSALGVQSYGQKSLFTFLPESSVQPFRAWIPADSVRTPIMMIQSPRVDGKVWTFATTRSFTCLKAGRRWRCPTDHVAANIFQRVASKGSKVLVACVSSPDLRVEFDQASRQMLGFEPMLSLRPIMHDFDTCI